MFITSARSNAKLPLINKRKGAKKLLYGQLAAKVWKCMKADVSV
jgi:hypothetical protein